MPHRELPEDFEQRYKSVWVDPPFHELADASRVGQYYNWTLDELVHAARAGFDGICVNEHHQNAYGFMPSPNLMGSALARETNGLDVAIVQMGSTLPTTNPPTRVAEEYAMLDCISGGRLVAGMPLGSAMDANLCYGIAPIEQRERYREAHDLIIKAWTSREMFTWNGKYQQLGMVNIWPRPIQTPHPPVWVPGLGSISTWDFAAQHDHCYCFLSYFGAMVGKAAMDGFWSFVDERGLEPNPHRAGFLQLVVVGDNDADAERRYGKHVEYFFQKSLHLPMTYLGPPGHQDYRSLAHSIRSGSAAIVQDIWGRLKDYKFKDLAKQQFVMAGSAESVRDQLLQGIRDLRVGNLMVLLPIGSMPHEVVIENIDRFAEGVLPHLRGEWSEWENRWWPERLRAPRPLASV